MLNSNSNCVYFFDCVNVAVHRCTGKDPRKLFVFHEGTAGNGSFTLITKNYAYNCGENFVSSTFCSDMQIEGNEFDISGTNGINVNGVRNVIKGNIIRVAARAGITMGGETAAGAGDYSIIEGNEVIDCKGGGIYNGVAQGGDYVKIINNLCKGHPTLQDSSSSRAFGIRSRGNYCIIEGNQIFGWFRTGISLTGQNATAAFDSRVLSSDRNLIKNNILIGNGQLGATETTNYFKGGIAIYGAGTETAYNTNNKIVGNICYNNIDYGILFRNSTGTVIEDNDLMGNVTGPILNVASNV